MTTKNLVDNVNAQSLLWDAGRAVCGLWPLIVSLGWLALIGVGMAAGYWVAVVAVPMLVAALVSFWVAVAAFVVAAAKVAVALVVVVALGRAAQQVGGLAQWAPKTGGWDARPAWQSAGVPA